MVKPVLRRRGAVGKPTSLPKPKKEAVTPESLARASVGTYEDARAELEHMLQSFETDFPEAASALQSIQIQEDVVTSLIVDAKALVGRAKKTIGDFICQIKHSKPKYDDDAFTDIVSQTKDMKTVQELFDAGAIKKISLVTASATKWFAQHPEASEAYQDAWREKAEMTPAVTVPKL